MKEKKRGYMLTFIWRGRVDVEGWAPKGDCCEGGSRGCAGKGDIIERTTAGGQQSAGEWAEPHASGDWHILWWCSQAKSFLTLDFSILSSTAHVWPSVCVLVLLYFVSLTPIFSSSFFNRLSFSYLLLLFFLRVWCGQFAISHRHSDPPLRSIKVNKLRQKLTKTGRGFPKFLLQSVKSRRGYGFSVRVRVTPIRKSKLWRIYKSVEISILYVDCVWWAVSNSLTYSEIPTSARGMETSRCQRKFSHVLR